MSIRPNQFGLGSLMLAVALVSMYTFVIVWILPIGGVEDTLPISAAGAIVGLGVGALSFGRRGAILGAAFGGAAGPIVWIVGMYLLWPI